MIAHPTMDQWILQFDRGLKALAGGISAGTARPNPAKDTPESALSDEERRHAAQLMRINHCGEICAQALYQGQLLTARDSDTKALLQTSCEEEVDHLAWCEHRLEELDSHITYLGGFFYIGSLSIGVLAGMMGDPWSLGFVTETERQVETHLRDHLEKLPEHDQRSRQILTQMMEDEIEHGDKAQHAGGRELPTAIKSLMNITSKVMTETTKWV